ncbi:hypothetical protein [Chromobacterium vaccinii]|uniref:hypothetical protein n=1 Tax=Chromobacterium vaccinii TaxID=1108595 RepID=UPI000AA007FA|nr:hypothetical protein [Chromobacterium vaccinii]
MAKLGRSDLGMAGLSCVSRRFCKQDHPDAPLMYAISYALGDMEKLDTYLYPVFPPYPDDVLAGGDPGWIWYGEQDIDGSVAIYAEIYDLIAPPEGIWNKYSPQKVRYEIRAALNNLLIKYPNLLSEVDQVIKKFDLIEVETIEGLMPIPRWDGKIPDCFILNESN